MLLFLLILLAAGVAMAQEHMRDLDVSLLFSGDTIKWYAEANGGNALAIATVLVTDIHYDATQTVSYTEGASRLEVKETING